VQREIDAMRLRQLRQWRAVAAQLAEAVRARREHEDDVASMRTWDEVREMEDAALAAYDALGVLPRAWMDRCVDPSLPPGVIEIDGRRYQLPTDGSA
jgi:hypothetical protein